MRVKEILPDHNDEGNELDYRDDGSFMFRADCHACRHSMWIWNAYRFRGRYYCDRLCVPPFVRMMSVTRSATWALALLFIASHAKADLPPCHPMLPAGFVCQMPVLPPPGGVLQAAPPSPCGVTTPAGATCTWPSVEVRAIEVIGTSSANPSEPIYRHTALLLLPHTPLDVPLSIDATVINYQRNMQDARFCGTGNEHRYTEAALWFETGNCPPVEQ